MTTYNGRPGAKGGKAVFVQRGAKGKWGAQSPPTASQPGFSTSGSPVAQYTSPVPAPTLKETVVSEADSKHMHDRMLFLLSNMIGMAVEITVKNGSKYEGLFHTAFTEGELGIVIRLAKAISGKDKKENAPLISQMIVLAKDCVAIHVIGVDFVPYERLTSERSEREGFKTDTDISRSGDIKERDLKKWAPEEHIALSGIEDDLGDMHRSGNTSWDQFAANERLFGVRTDFNEDLYTTKLDRTGADFKAREQQAIQIANEIQQTVSSNVHMREERGLAVDDSGLDEEDLYGAVVRDPLPVSNKYMPPAMRRQQEQSQQKRSSTPSNQNSVSRASPALAPVQAAPSLQPLVQTTRPQAATQQSQQSQTSTSASTEQPAISATAAAMGNIGASAIIPSKLAETPLSRSNSIKANHGQFNLNDLRTHNPVSALLNAATIQGSKNQQIPEHAVDAKQIEDNLAKFAMTARTFATNDKALVNQTKMGLTQRRTELFQKEKDGLAAELKQFGKEMSKKLNNTPVPDDVKEIFGKKSDHSVAAVTAATAIGDNSKAAAASNTEKERPAADPKDVKPTVVKAAAVGTVAPSTSAEKQVAEKSGSGSSFKFNVKASVFKPNVNAAPFTPSFAVGGEKKASPAGVPGAADKNLFFGKMVKKGPLSLHESMYNPFKKGQTIPNPTSITPTWPYGQRAFRHLFQVTSRYEEDLMYSQGMGGQHGGSSTGSYYTMAPYSYGPSGQYGVPPPMTMGGPNHMVPFMGTGGPVPFSQAPPPPGMPQTGAGPGFPQMAPTSGPHYPPQGFPPGRTGMIAPAGMHIPMYPYPPTPHGAPVMMRYPPPEMMPPMGPNGMLMHQRPLSLDPQMMHYPAGSREAGPSEEVASESSTNN
ncbi:hypothetical protein BGX28_010177 [Mortierella sp. GBA30]|nr:hypothetical protein BGX28_010177 [Mortierella sp. GBA30]